MNSPPTTTLAGIDTHIDRIDDRQLARNLDAWPAEFVTGPSAVPAGLLAVVCSSSSASSDGCFSAALAQASAELELGGLLAEAPQAESGHVHEDEAESHEHDEGLVLAASVDVIIAEAATREQCG